MTAAPTSQITSTTNDHRDREAPVHAAEGSLSSVPQGELTTTPPATTTCSSSSATASRSAPDDFRERVIGGGRQARPDRRSDLDEDETLDLVELAADGRIAEPRSSLGQYLMRHWERLSLNDGESLVYWLRKLVFRGAYLDHRVKEGLLEVSFDETTGDFGYAEPEGGRALLELAPDPELALAAVQARSERRRRSPEPVLVLGGTPIRISRIAPSGTMSSSGSPVVAVRAERHEAEAGLGRDRREAMQRAVGELDADRLPARARARRGSSRSAARSARRARRAGPSSRASRARASEEAPVGARTPTCARPSSVITRPRGVRWRKPSWSRYGS